MGGSEQGSGELTLCMLGCGMLGTAILSGILASLQELQSPKPLQSPGGAHEEVPERLPSRFIACVRRPESAKRVKATLWQHSSVLRVVYDQNVASVAAADVVILGCKPQRVGEVLSEPGMARSLHGKLLISICAGVTVAQIERHLHGAVPEHDPEVDGRCRVVRAMPNTASLIREGMTVVASSTPPPPAQTTALVTWIFRRVGDVVYLPPSAMDASTALCGSGPAFFALVLEGAIDGAVAMGLPREEARRMAAQTMRGATGMVLAGESPASLRESVCTPGGCTIGGVLVLEEGSVRGTVARAVREATCVASQLGKGAQGVNGTRFRGGME